MENIKKYSNFAAAFNNGNCCAKLYVISPSGAPNGSILDGRFLFYHLLSHWHFKAKLCRCRQKVVSLQPIIENFLPIFCLLRDTCLTAQDRYKLTLDYFKIKYWGSWFLSFKRRILLGSITSSEQRERYFLGIVYEKPLILAEMGDQQQFFLL